MDFSLILTLNFQFKTEYEEFKLCCWNLRHYFALPPFKQFFRNLLVLSPSLFSPDQDKTRWSSCPPPVLPTQCRLRWRCLPLSLSLEKPPGSQMVVHWELSTWGRQKMTFKSQELGCHSWSWLSLWAGWSKSFVCNWTLFVCLRNRHVLTFHIQQLVLVGDLRGLSEHSLAVEDPLIFRGGVLQHKPSGGVIGHVSSVDCDFLCRDLSVQGCLSLGLSHTTGDDSRHVWTQVYDLKVDGRWNEEVFFVWLEEKVSGIKLTKRIGFCDVWHKT